MRLLQAFAMVAALGLAGVAYAQAPGPKSPSPTDSSSGLSAKYVSAIVGMKVETPAGATLGIVKDVVVDGYGQATYAIVSYGGMLGLGNNYTAVPWMSLAEMLHSDRLLVDQARLENAPVLSGARPDSANRTWRREADAYWRDKLAVAPASGTSPADLGASGPSSQSVTPPEAHNP